MNAAQSLLLLVPFFLQDPADSSLEKYLTRCEQFGFSGSVLIAQQGKVILAKGYGLSNREKGEANNPDTVFEIASATKPFTACAILKLQEMEKLSIDDRIEKYFAEVPQDKREITIRHLLSHTSGMPRSAVRGGSPDLAKAVAGYLSTPLSNKPGETHEYWNGGYALLAGIIEKVSGQSYMDFCREQLFKLAGLKRTGFTGDAKMENEAIAYENDRAIRNATGHPYRDYGWQYRGMGGIVSSVQDLWQFLQAFDTGRILKPETIELMETEVRGNYGLGWGVTKTSRGTRRIGHGGDVLGFHAQIQRFPAERTTILVLSNVEDIPLWTIAWNLESLLFQETPKYPLPPESISLAEEKLNSLCARYGHTNGNGVIVERAGNGLLLGIEDLELSTLLGQSNDKLKIEIEKAIEIVNAVQKKDVKTIRDMLLEGIPPTWPQQLVDEIWPEHLKRWGELQKTEVIGATLVGKNRVELLIAMQHECGAPRLKIILQNQRLNIFDLNGPRFTASFRYQPISDTGFVSFSWMGAALPRIRFEIQEGRASELMIQLVSGREERLLRKKN